MPNGITKEPKLKSEGEIREEVIKDFGFDPEEETHQGLITKITSERLESQKKLTTAISQKINYRKAKDYYKTHPEKAVAPKEEKSLVEKEENKFVTKEEFEKDRLRRQYSYLEDDEFDFINAQAKGSGKSFNDVLESPIVKTHLESVNALNRIVGATSSPSTRFKASSEKEEDKIANELDRDLPVGFSSKKN